MESIDSSEEINWAQLDIELQHSQDWSAEVTMTEQGWKITQMPKYLPDTEKLRGEIMEAIRSECSPNHWLSLADIGQPVRVRVPEPFVTVPK